MFPLYFASVDERRIVYCVHDSPPPDAPVAATKALEESLQSSVRLCVVAPTVNVSFGGQTQAYKAPMPKAKIQQTLEVEILPRFAQCFTQLQEATAPGGQVMDDWLKDVTMEMQGSIEKHLSKVFQG